MTLASALAWRRALASPLPFPINAWNEQQVARIERQRKPGLARLTEFSLIVPNVAAPVFRQNSVPHVAMKRGVRPVAHPRDQTVLHRVEMNVIHVPFEIAFVANGVFPEAALPQRGFAVRAARDKAAGCRNGVGEAAFDSAPAV